MSITKFGNHIRDFPTVWSHIFNWEPALFDKDWFNNFMFATVPLVNVKENDAEYTLEVLAPKLEPADIKIEVEDNVLHLSTEQENDEASDDNLRQEYKLSYSNRSFKLPKDADGGKITATTEKGIILIHVPKKEVTESSRKLIEIQ